jgi:muramoyltetrapeptide carboxypeptidase
VVMKAPSLCEGDLVAIVAPSGPVNEDALNRGVKVLENLGLRVRITKHVQDRWGYLAGNDRDRAEDLSEVWMDPSVKAVICARGGYGAMRILPYLDFEKLRAHRKILVGYSDITALHVAFWREMRLVTYHGPVAEAGEDSGLNVPYNLASFKEILFGSKGQESTPLAGGGFATLQPPAGQTLTTLEEGEAEGIVVGGNLSLIASTIGSRWELDTRGKILFLEEVGERPYRMDRMLCQLALSGMLASAAGYILGDFTDCEASEGAMSFSASEVIGQYFAGTGKPCIAGIPAGHGRYRATIPFGTKIRIRATPLSANETPSVCYLESPTRR